MTALIQTARSFSPSQDGPVILFCALLVACTFLI